MGWSYSHPEVAFEFLCTSLCSQHDGVRTTMKKSYTQNSDDWILVGKNQKVQNRSTFKISGPEGHPDPD